MHLYSADYEGELYFNRGPMLHIGYVGTTLRLDSFRKRRGGKGEGGGNEVLQHLKRKRKRNTVWRLASPQAVSLVQLTLHSLRNISFFTCNLLQLSRSYARRRSFMSLPLDMLYTIYTHREREKWLARTNENCGRSKSPRVLRPVKSRKGIRSTFPVSARNRKVYATSIFSSSVGSARIRSSVSLPHNVNFPSDLLSCCR